jgi:hypothetical protein
LSKHPLSLTSSLLYLFILCPSAWSAPSAADNASIKKGYDAAANATVVKVEHKATTYTCGIHKFEMTPPEGFEFRELTPDFGKVFLFSGKKHEDGKAPVFTVTVIVPPKGEVLPPVQVILDSTLAPFKEHLSGYDRQPKKPLTQNSKSFEGASFSGEYPDHSLTRGFVYVTQYKGAFFSVFGQDATASFDSAMKVFLASFQSLKIVD